MRNAMYGKIIVIFVLSAVKCKKYILSATIYVMMTCCKTCVYFTRYKYIYEIYRHTYILITKIFFNIIF